MGGPGIQSSTGKEDQGLHHVTLAVKDNRFYYYSPFFLIVIFVMLTGDQNPASKCKTIMFPSLEMQKLSCSPALTHSVQGLPSLEIPPPNSFPARALNQPPPERYGDAPSRESIGS